VEARFALTRILGMTGFAASMLMVLAIIHLHVMHGVASDYRRRQTKRKVAMATLNEKLTLQWKDAANLVLGLWLAISPWALFYAGEPGAAWNAHTVGVIIAVAALAALIAFQTWEEWVNTALAAWLIVSPYLLGFTALSDALWNQLIVGVLVGVLAIWTAATASEGGLTAKS
jgi:SPW repeat